MPQFSGSNRVLFPFVLVALYAALFSISYLTNDYQSNYSAQILIKCIFCYIVGSYAVGMPRSSFVNYFCLAQLASIVNNLAFFISYTQLEGLNYVIAAGWYYSIELILISVDIVMLIGIVYGSFGGSMGNNYRLTSALSHKLVDLGFSKKN